MPASSRCREAGLGRPEPWRLATRGYLPLLGLRALIRRRWGSCPFVPEVLGLSLAPRGDHWPSHRRQWTRPRTTWLRGALPGPPRARPTGECAGAGVRSGGNSFAHLLGDEAAGRSDP